MSTVRRTPLRRATEPAPPPAEPYPPGRPGSDWREEVVGAAGLNVIAGIWLIISPWVLGYTGADHVWNPVVFGAVVGVLALARVAGLYRETWISWINAAIGIWLFISAFWLAESSQASWNVGVLGAVVFLLALWSGEASADHARRASSA